MGKLPISIPAYPLSAALLGALGGGVFAGIANLRFGLEWSRALEILAEAQVIGLLNLVLIVRMERVGWIKRRVLVHPLVTWTIMLGIFALAYCHFFPEMRGRQEFAWMAFPLWFSNWWIAPIFGLIQDAWVRFDARRAKRAKSPA